MAICKNCSQTLVWAKPYQKGNKPLNPDGTPHNCLPGGEDHHPAQQTFNPQVDTSNNPQQTQLQPQNPVREMSKIESKFQEVDVLDEMLYGVAIRRLDAICKELNIEDITKLDPSQALIFLESWARTLAQTLK